MTLKNLSAWYSTLTPTSLGDIAQIYSASAHFKDPFNDVHGVKAIEHIFRHMFATTQNPRFVIVDSVQQGEQAFLTWQFNFGLHGKEYTVLGASHLRFNAQGLVYEHRDYWDAAEELWAKLPLVGGPVRWLRRRFAVG